MQNPICSSLYLGLFVVISITQSIAQGCMPAKHIPPNLGTQNLSYLVDGQWEAGLSYRYLHSNHVYEGKERLIERNQQGTETRMYAHTFNVFGRYSFTHRWSLILNVPIITLKESFIHADGERHWTSPGTQIGDIRISANYWLLDPLTHQKGNVALGLGLKMPTGDHRVQDTWFNADGSTELRDLDIAQQPGDGGWGLIFEAYWIQRLSEILSAYASGFYLITPKNMNDSPQPMFFPPEHPLSTFGSVPDQFNVRGGLTATVSKFALGLGLRYDGMPINDLIGDSDGFRRPGYILYAEPAFTWSNIIQTVNIAVPVALTRAIETSVYEQSLGTKTRGGLADYLILVGYTHRF